jgi:uncharacterized protein YdhG (YjbR/CyaY superfamily)
LKVKAENKKEFINIISLLNLMNEEVDKYIKKQPSPQKEICQKLREIILSTFPSIEEKMKYGVPYYNEKFHIVGLKDHVNLGFSIKNFSKEEISLFEGTGKTTRHIKIPILRKIKEKEIIKLLRLVKKNNKKIGIKIII